MITSTPREIQSFSGTVFQLAASSFWLNSPAAMTAKSYTSFEKTHEAFAEAENPKGLTYYSWSIRLLRIPCQLVARCVMALFITTFIAPMGVASHLIHLSLYIVRLVVMTAYSNLSGQESFQKGIERDKFSVVMHTKAAGNDLLVTLSAIAGAMIFVNPVAINFAFRPLTATANYLPKSTALGFLVMEALKREKGYETTGIPPSIRVAPSKRKPSFELLTTLNGFNEVLPKFLKTPLNAENYPSKVHLYRTLHVSIDRLHKQLIPIRGITKTDKTALAALKSNMMVDQTHPDYELCKAIRAAISKYFTLDSAQITPTAVRAQRALLKRLQKEECIERVHDFYSRQQGALQSHGRSWQMLTVGAALAIGAAA